MLSLNIFVCAYFNEGAFHVDMVTPLSSNLPEETGLKGRCEGREGGVDEVTHRYE